VRIQRESRQTFGMTPSDAGQAALADGDVRAADTDREAGSRLREVHRQAREYLHAAVEAEVGHGHEGVALGKRCDRSGLERAIWSWQADGGGMRRQMRLERKLN